MLKTGDVLDLGPLRTIFHIKRTAAETNGGSFEMEWELGPQTGGTPVHTHPTAIESYEVLAGQLDVYVDGTWQTLSPGEKITVAKGIPHTFRNAGNEVTRVYNAHQPAMKFDEYFGRLHRLVNSGVVKSDKMTFKALLHLSMLMTSYPEEIRPVRPPAAAMRLFGSLGRLLGYQV